MEETWIQWPSVLQIPPYEGKQIAHCLLMTKTARRWLESGEPFTGYEGCPTPVLVLVISREAKD